ncbi:MAG: DUF5060 domain-containing protein [Planctomycetota bacterium]
MAPSASGQPTQWQTMEIDFAGPSATELGGSFNPFLDRRLEVEFFAPDGSTSYVVPGFYDGDGAGGGDGNVWRARFTPDTPGQWVWTASFREGAQVAIDLSNTAGADAENQITSVTAPGLDLPGLVGAFEVTPAAIDAPGFRGTGRLEYAGGHYL